MNPTKCEDCGSEDITFYKQKRVDGVWVVTARCDKGHKPNKYKPFYPVYNFHLDELPELETAPKAPRQLSWEEQLREDYKNEHA